MGGNMVKNSNWQEANQLAISQAWPTICTQDYQEQIQLVIMQDLNLGPLEFTFSDLTAQPRKKTL